MAHCAIIGEKHNPTERERNEKMMDACKTVEVEEVKEKKKKKTIKQIFVVPKSKSDKKKGY